MQYIFRTELQHAQLFFLNFGILPENRIFDMFLGNEDTLPNAKSSSVLPWLAPVINQNAKQQLALS